MGKALGVTGRRPKYFPWRYDENDPRCIGLKSDMYKIIVDHINNGFDTFVCGMALGSDMYFAEAVLQARNDYPDIKLVGEIPFTNQSSQWLMESRYRYDRIRRQCDEWNVLSDTYDPKMFFLRNKNIIDRSDELLAVWDGNEEGGTAQAVGLAKDKGIPIIPLNYNDYKLTELGEWYHS